MFEMIVDSPFLTAIGFALSAIILIPCAEIGGWLKRSNGAQNSRRNLAERPR